MSVHVPDEIAEGADGVVVLCFEEILHEPEAIQGDDSSTSSRVAARTVVKCSAVGGGRCGLLAEMTSALARQGLSVVKASVRTAAVRNPKVGSILVAVNDFVVVDAVTQSPTFDPRRRREIELTVKSQVCLWVEEAEVAAAMAADAADAERLKVLGLGGVGPMDPSGADATRPPFLRAAPSARRPQARRPSPGNKVNGGASAASAGWTVNHLLARPPLDTRRRGGYAQGSEPESPLSPGSARGFAVNPAASFALRPPRPPFSASPPLVDAWSRPPAGQPGNKNPLSNESLGNGSLGNGSRAGGSPKALTEDHAFLDALGLGHLVHLVGQAASGASSANPREDPPKAFSLLADVDAEHRARSQRETAAERTREQKSGRSPQAPRGEPCAPSETPATHEPHENEAPASTKAAMAGKQDASSFSASGACGTIDEREAFGLFTQFDLDGSGSLDLGEFTSYLESVFVKLQTGEVVKAQAGGASNPRAMVEATAQQCFADADADKSGALSYPEFKQWFKQHGATQAAPGGCPKVSPIEVKESPQPVQPVPQAFASPLVAGALAAAEAKTRALTGAKDSDELGTGELGDELAALGRASGADSNGGAFAEPRFVGLELRMALGRARLLGSRQASDSARGSARGGARGLPAECSHSRLEELEALARYARRALPTIGPLESDLSAACTALLSDLDTHARLASACLIQALIRGYAARLQLRNAVFAAICVTRHLRGFLVRRHLDVAARAGLLDLPLGLSGLRGDLLPSLRPNNANPTAPSPNLLSSNLSAGSSHGPARPRITAARQPDSSPLAAPAAVHAASSLRGAVRGAPSAAAAGRIQRKWEEFLTDAKGKSSRGGRAADCLEERRPGDDSSSVGSAALLGSAGVTVEGSQHGRGSGATSPYRPWDPAAKQRRERHLRTGQGASP